MKKAILHPLCSAFIVPGLGQIMNQNVKKGAAILGATFLLFILAAVKLSFMIKAAASGIDFDRLQPAEVLTRLHSQSFGVLWALIALFALVWLYSVVDAFREGWKLDHAGEERS